MNLRGQEGWRGAANMVLTGMCESFMWREGPFTYFNKDSSIWYRDEDGFSFPSRCTRDSFINNDSDRFTIKGYRGAE